MRAEYPLAEQLLREAIGFSSSTHAGEQMSRLASQALSLVPAVARGDYLASSRMLAPAIVQEHQFLSDRVMLKGNVAACLCEAGRLARCEQLLRSALRESQPAGLDVYSGAYLAVLGCAKAGRGDAAMGIELIREGIADSIRGGDEQGADQSRVCLSVILRASGEPGEALVLAERALERLTVDDTCRFRRLAALEVAASLLSIGDVDAAASWAGAVVDEGFEGNQYHALRAAMILAEVERRQGRSREAVDRIRDQSEYLLSENPNWQVAMYCRAFPGLMGVIAQAVNPSRLPSHLLQMIPSETSEQILKETSSFLDPEMWSSLGERLVGAAEMDRYLARDGLPLCHVRLLGGLEVSVGGRAVRERDWKKRKARLLFAMLVTRQGRDVPRDQVVDYLWPEMDEDRAKNNLYVAWSTMKSVLCGSSEKRKPCPYVESVGGVCRIIGDVVRSDIDEFDDAMAMARDAESEGRAKDALSAYERIASLYRGDLLPGDVYDDWFASSREYYRSEFVDAMIRAAQLLVSADDPGNALIYLRRAIQADPVREDLYQRALRCQIGAGQRSSAIDTYMQCRSQLSESLGLDPSMETRQLYDQILAMEDRPRAIPMDPFGER
jgi:DNA-binding SARP family transcriptional activator